VIFVENPGLGRGQTNSHGDAAAYLVVVGQSAHDAAAVVGAEEAQNPELACIGVDLHLAELGGKGIGCLVCRIWTPVADADQHPLLLETG